MLGVPAAATTAATAASFPRTCRSTQGGRRRRHHSPPIFFKCWLPLRGRRRNCRPLSLFYSRFVLFPTCLLSSTILLPPSPCCPSFAHPVCPSIVLVRLRSRSSLFRPRSGYRSLLPPALRTRRTVWKGAPRKGTARTRAIKRTSSSAPISVEGSPSLRYGTRGSISGGGNFSRRGGDEHQRPSSPSSRSLFLLQRCNRRLYYFRERERKCSKTEKRGEEGNGMAGGCLTHGDETRGDRAAGNADRPFVLFFVKGNLCLARTCLAILEMRPTRFIRDIARVQ